MEDSLSYEVSEGDIFDGDSWHLVENLKIDTEKHLTQAEMTAIIPGA